MIIFFLKKGLANISPREEKQNLNITKYEFIKKSIEIVLTYSFGAKKIFSSVLQYCFKTDSEKILAENCYLIYYYTLLFTNK